jgi:DUF917 family protein
VVWKLVPYLETAFLSVRQTLCFPPHVTRGITVDNGPAWSIGRSIALSRRQKLDPVSVLLKEQNGVLLFRGKITSVTRHVAKGFSRGSVLLSPFSEDSTPSDGNTSPPSTSLSVEFENENLCAVLKQEGQADQVLAVCPDLICFLDMANGAPLGISDYKFGLRVSVVALRAPPIWTTEKGLKMGGPSAFGYVLATCDARDGYMRANEETGLPWNTTLSGPRHTRPRRACGTCSRGDSGVGL